MTDSLWGNILGIAYIILVVIDVVLILIQQSRKSGLGAIAGDSGNYFQGNMGKTKDAIYSRATIVVSLIIVALTIVLNIIVK